MAVFFVRLVLFDANGTLIDDLRMIFHTVLLTLRHFGVKSAITLDEFRASVRLPIYDWLIDIGLPRYITWKEFWAAMQLRLPDRLADGLFPEVPSVLSELKLKGYLLGIVSSAPRKLLSMQLLQMGIAHYFAVVLAEGDYVHGKPSPEPILRAVRMSEGRRPVVYIGDMAEDILAAHAAGVKAFAIHREHGYNDLNRLRAAKPDLIIENLAELLALV